MEIAESPISKTGNEVWDKTFNECFWENMRQVMWSHSCMFNGQHYVAKGYECNWCGCKEEDETKTRLRRSCLRYWSNSIGSR